VRRGPGPSIHIPDCVTEGTLSNYKTPDDIISDQSEEFHVINVIRGDVTSLQKVLQHVKKVRMDSSRINVELDLESKPSSVEVNINQHREKRPGYSVPGIENLYLVGDSLKGPGAGGDVGHESVLGCYVEMTGKNV